MAMEKTEGQRRVLIAVDGSENAAQALHWYTEKFNQPNDLVLLVHVQESLPYKPVEALPYSFAYAYYEDWLKDIRDIKKRGNSLINSYVQKCKAHNLHFKTMLKSGQPENVICQTVTEEDVDVIIMGSRGQGRIRRTLMGSVSTYCVHHAHVPVIVVPHREHQKLFGMENVFHKEKKKT